MAHLYGPGMKMYQVIWERDGERMYEHIEHAADEADACSRAEASVAELVESEFALLLPRSNSTMTSEEWREFWNLALFRHAGAV
jgi:hypothetical protein